MTVAHHLVTSFSKAGYAQYGRKFLESWQQHWSDVPLAVFHEGTSPEIEGPLYLDLREDEGLRRFLKQHGRDPKANGVCQLPNGRLVLDYRWQAVKFGCKVFAFTSGHRPSCAWWIWIDADVVFKAAPTEAFWERVTPEDSSVSYIGRDSRDWYHSECGWVAYRMPDCQKLLKKFREVYESGDVFRFPEWHDSYIFDALRLSPAADDLKFLNLAEGIRGMHPWPDTILGTVADHHKGPMAKKEFYG